MKIIIKGLKNLTFARLMTFVILACIFLGSLNLINRYYYFIFIAGLLFLVTPKRRFRLGVSFFVLLAFSMSILIFDPGSQTMTTNMIKPFAYPLCYLMGVSLFSTKEKEAPDLIREEKRTSAVIYVITGGVMLHFILNMITNWGLDDRNVIDFWTKDDMSATGQATLACFMIAVVAAFLFSNVGKLKKIIAVAALVVILSYNLILAGRTIFALLLILLGFAFLYNLYENKISRKSLGIIVAVVLIAALLFALYSSNLFGIKDAVEDSNFYDRFFGGNSTQELDDDKRMTYKLMYLDLFFDHLWGGGAIHKEVGHHAHDLYLDTYSDAGIFAFLAIVIYVLSSLYRAIKCAFSRNLTFQTRSLILCTYLTVNIQFWLEPILNGVPWLLAAYCLIDGAVTRLLWEEEKI